MWRLRCLVQYSRQAWRRPFVAGVQCRALRNNFALILSLAGLRLQLNRTAELPGRACGSVDCDGLTRLPARRRPPSRP